MNKVKDRVSVKVPYNKVDSELHKAYCKVLQEAKAIRDKILAIYCDSAEYKAFKLLYDSYDVYTLEHYIEVSFTIERDKQAVRSTYIEPSFLKLLLQSRLLTDTEKRNILQRQGILLAQDAVEAKNTEEEKDKK